MKVDNSFQPMTNVTANEGKKRIGKETSQKTDPAQTDNQVHISSQAAQLQGVDSSSDSNAVMDMARIQEIKQAISEGNFQVNSEAVADRLLETARELLESKKSDT